MPKNRDAVKIVDRLTGPDRALRRRIARERINAEVARMIYDTRTKAGLSQRELADLVGTKQPVIARLEDADYSGHSLSMLQRIAAALDRRVEIRFTALRRKRRAA
jgi:ribosome-binding protein aMBF1 (putative translation factor)